MESQTAELSPFARRAMLALWPAFLMAGVQAALVFVVVDPGDLHWFGSAARLDWPAQAVYSVTFLIFWLTTSIATALTQLLLPAPENTAGNGAAVPAL